MPTPAESAAKALARRREQRALLSDVGQQARSESFRLYEATREIKKGNLTQAAERQLVSGHANDLFPTPPELAAELVRDLQALPGSKVIEPSAGTGRIAMALKNAGHTPMCIELSHANAKFLDQQGFTVWCGDFLQWPDYALYFVMNPPFSKGQDIAHVRHAYAHMLDGGRLVSVMSEGVFFRQDKQATEFRQWIENVGGKSYRLPKSTFKASGTNVATRKVIISK